MATAHSVMTTGEPPDGAWNTPTSCLASPLRLAVPQIQNRTPKPPTPNPTHPPTVQGRGPNSSLVWQTLGRTQRGNNAKKHERSDTHTGRRDTGKHKKAHK